MKLTPASPGPVCMGAPAAPRTPGFNAPARRASLGVTVRTWWTGAANHPVRMGVAVSSLEPTASVPLGGAAACVTYKVYPARRLQPGWGCGWSSCARRVDSVWTRATPTTVCVQRAAPAVTVNRKWTPARPSPATTGAPAVVTWGAMCVSVRLAILVTAVRTMWMSVPPSPVSTEALVLTL